LMCDTIVGFLLAFRMWNESDSLATVTRLHTVSYLQKGTVSCLPT